ncbi:putative DNA-binding domain-containing protein [Methylocystis sp. FS]|uniref:HvfC/BufC family peptide modification chaperone n=1 Tax=Methylocystis silviterrae TaxID=2743612 RepID=UPI0015822346|nr:putative DNA-binding domain-containing protein [Methylocystis silviterrae]
MSLAELQGKFQAGILSEDQIVPDSIADSKKTDAATLFSVYHSAYRLRLAEFLSNDYPILRNYLGDETFGALVEEYIASAPSHVRSARWYGGRLPGFMKDSARLRDDVQAIDLARFERALADVFDAADGPQLPVNALAQIPVESWPNIAFEFHPSFVLLELAVGTAARYEATSNEEWPPGIGQGDECVLFWRSDNQSSYRVVAPDERLALIEALKGQKFSDICSLLAFHGAGEDVTHRVAGFLAQWFTEGLVARLSSFD